MNTLPLEVLGLQFPTDKLHPHDYLRHYERYLGHLRDKAFNLLEIGVLKGDSLRLWEAYFTQATIIGVDIQPMQVINTERVTTTTIDVNEYSPDRTFGVVIDDGSHVAKDIDGAFWRLWPVIESGGWYIIEDLRELSEPELNRSLAYEKLFNLLHETGDVEEIHVHPQIMFLHKK